MKPTNSLLARYLRFVESRNWVAAEAFPVLSRALRVVLWTLAAVFAVTYAVAGPIAHGGALGAILLVTLVWTLWFCVWAAGFVVLFTLFFRLARTETPDKLTGKYLGAVGSYLPPDQPEDIVAELAADIRAQMEDREAELGRPLTAEEVETILKHHGHPMLVAGRYLPRQHLIGPAIFPFYWFTLKTALWIAALVYAVAAVSVPYVRGLMQAAGDTSPHEVTVAGAWVFLCIGALVLLAVFGGVTAIFAVLEISPNLAPFRKWSVETLSAEVPPRGKARWELILGLIASGLFAACWLAMPDFPFNLGPVGRFLMPGEAWPFVRIAMVLLMLAAVVDASVRMARPRWTRFSTAILLAQRAAGLALLAFLMHSSDSLVVVRLARIPETAHRLPQIVGQSIFYGSLMALLIAAVTDLFQALPYLRRWFLRPRAAAHLNAL